MVVKALVDHPVASWVFRRAGQLLTGRALACAVNARNHLVRAQRIADQDISNTVAYFCATHATEEAVAAFVASAKEHGYRKLARKVNVRDHAQKAVVAAYVQIIAGYAHDMKLKVAHDPTTDNVLVKIPMGDADAVYPLGLGLFSFNEDNGCHSSDAALQAFTSLFPSSDKMVERVHSRATFRDQALYAGDEGAPALTRKQLDDGLREHTFLTLGLIWAALDVSNHTKQEPFVLQTLGAVSSVIEIVRPTRVCRHCGH